MFNKLLGSVKKKPKYGAPAVDDGFNDSQETPKPGRAGLFGANFLGMTAVQRFIVSIMLFMLVCMIGLLFLLVTETIVPY